MKLFTKWNLTAKDDLRNSKHCRHLNKFWFQVLWWSSLQNVYHFEETPFIKYFISVWKNLIRNLYNQLQRSTGKSRRCKCWKITFYIKPSKWSDETISSFDKKWLESRLKMEQLKIYTNIYVCMSYLSRVN